MSGDVKWFRGMMADGQLTYWDDNDDTAWQIIRVRKGKYVVTNDGYGCLLYLNDPEAFLCPTVYGPLTTLKAAKVAYKLVAV